MAYLEERYPEPPLLPERPAARARARLLVHRFDDLLGDDYYAFRRGDANELAGELDALEVGAEPLRGHRVRAVGDPRARHARRRAARARRGVAGRARAAAVGRRRGRDWCGRCERDRRSTSSRRGSARSRSLDVRTPGEFDGTLGQPCDPRQGHIPGARNLDVYRLMELDARRDRGRARARAGRRGRSRTATAARARRSRRRCCARSATTRATTSARGTSGRATTTCRSSPEPRLTPSQCRRRGEERAAEPRGRAPATPAASRRARARARRAAAAASGSSSANHASTWSRRTSGWNCTAHARARRRGTPAAPGRARARRRRPAASNA